MTKRDSTYEEDVGRSEEFLVKVIYEHGPLNYDGIHQKLEEAWKKENKRDPNFLIMFGTAEQPHNLEDEVHRLYDIGILQLRGYKNRQACFTITSRAREVFPNLDY